MSAVLRPACFRLLSGLSLLMAIGGCTSGQEKNTAPDVSASSGVLLYQDIDPELGERWNPDEKAVAREISLLIEQSLRKQYTPGNARRDAHPKSHGCVKAEFHVQAALPERLARGVFIPDKTYPAWIRFSNGSSDASKADIDRDARGIAIKLMGVPGTKLLEDERQATTQDFIMINHPVFFANDPERYLSFMKDGNSDSFLASCTFRSLLAARAR